MSIRIKPMKLSFIKNEGTWDKVISDLSGNIIFEQREIILLDENANKQYFDDWENQLKSIPHWNIIEVERFI